LMASWKRFSKNTRRKWWWLLAIGARSPRYWNNLVRANRWLSRLPSTTACSFSHFLPANHLPCCICVS